ncbi:MAG: hypothetical protein RL654_1198 [Pseudomonadota bacterium]|jgi:uncharacterized protein (DUF1800 family)
MKTSLALLIGALLLGGAVAGGQAQQITMLAAPSSLVPQGVMLLSRTAPLMLRVRGSLVRGVGPRMTVRLNGKPLGTVAVDHADWRDHAFVVPSTLAGGATLEIVFDNDAAAGSEDRNLFIASVAQGTTRFQPGPLQSVYDRGAGALAFDGKEVSAGRSDLPWDGALRITWPGVATAVLSTTARLQRQQAARLLQQASFGALPGEIEQLAATGLPAWIDRQLALPASADFVGAVQARYDLGPEHRPHGAQYHPHQVGHHFWRHASQAPDQLRARTAFALHQIFMVSQQDDSLWLHARAYARYLDLLNRQAFGNFRDLIEEMALSPAMGLYLSHMRNLKEDPTRGRLPDENFARELMQLFTIGLHELRPDGSVVTDAGGRPVETYGNADVMALARVFTGYGWAFPDNELTEAKLRAGWPDYSAAADPRIDLQRMKAYPGQHSLLEKRLFVGKPWERSIAAGGSAASDLKIALDTLFNHPNVGPFIGRQLIQRLVRSDPSPAYVARVAAVFANNGRGVRGDLGAVVRAILLDAEARSLPAAGTGHKLREPALRVAQWMRAFEAHSQTGQFRIDTEMEATGQRVMMSPSVFGHFRPGHVPAGTTMGEQGRTMPEFQLINETSTATWVNLALRMSGAGLGWTGSGSDVSARYDALAELAGRGDLDGVVDQLDLRLFAGGMSAGLRQTLIDTMADVRGHDATSHQNRVRAAVLFALASPEYLIQR